jgi:hypothetical protein
MNRNLKKQLIKIGNENPELRGNVRRILKSSVRSRTSSYSERYPEDVEAFETVMDRLGFEPNTKNSWDYVYEGYCIKIWVSLEPNGRVMSRSERLSEREMGSAYVNTSDSPEALEKAEKERLKLLKEDVRVWKKVPKNWL